MSLNHLYLIFSYTKTKISLVYFQTNKNVKMTPISTRAAFELRKKKSEFAGVSAFDNYFEI